MIPDKILCREVLEGSAKQEALGFELLLSLERSAAPLEVGTLSPAFRGVDDGLQ